MRQKQDKCEEKRGRCLECGKTLPAGRNDMKFCSVTCKSRHHYRKDSNFEAYKRKVLRAIDRNYRILDVLLRSGVTSIEIPDLVLRGYNLGIVTSCFRVRSRYECRCFNLKFFMTETKLSGLARAGDYPPSLQDGGA